LSHSINGFNPSRDSSRGVAADSLGLGLGVEVSTLLEILARRACPRPTSASYRFVSTLLEILGGVDEALRLYEPQLRVEFQPFLRFWGRYVDRCNGSGDVSTLLEILAFLRFWDHAGVPHVRQHGIMFQPFLRF